MAGGILPVAEKVARVPFSKRTPITSTTSTATSSLFMWAKTLTGLSSHMKRVSPIPWVSWACPTPPPAMAGSE